MSESDTLYCRLCAEPTTKISLIGPDEDVAVTSKIVTKLLWINIDLTLETLPKSICFSCFDLLERTYIFLRSVRKAQEKLKNIFTVKNGDKNKSNLNENVAKPVDKDWEEFEETKHELKIEVEGGTVEEVDPNTLLNCIGAEIKNERSSIDDSSNIYDNYNSSDEDDQPLLSVATKRKENELNFITIDLNSSLSWSDFTWLCGKCDALFQNPQSLRMHSLQIHTQCCVFKCNDCNRNIYNYKMFIKHVKEHKQYLSTICHICNKKYPRVSLLNKHYSTHKSELRHSCENCGSTFETKEQLMDHVIIYSKYLKRDKNKKSNLKCDVCGKEFKSKGNLQTHKLLHTERKRDFSCDKCGKLFFTKGTLITHMMTHEDVKPYKCEHCSLSFRARGNLQSHLSLHDGMKPFVCEQCGKSFRIKRLLKSHYIVHTDLRPYVCEYCNKSFRFKTRLNLHLRQHTGARPYTCVYCAREFANGSNFKKHVKRRHNVDTSKKKYVEIIQEHNNIMNTS